MRKCALITLLSGLATLVAVPLFSQWDFVWPLAAVTVLSIGAAMSIALVQIVRARA